MSETGIKIDLKFHIDDTVFTMSVEQAEKLHQQLDSFFGRGKQWSLPLGYNPAMTDEPVLYRRGTSDNPIGLGDK